MTGAGGDCFVDGGQVRDVWAHTSTTVTANGDAVIEAKVSSVFMPRH